MEQKRCPWARSELEIRYHDEEWGRPLHDEHRLFEMLVLEGMQAGLSWNLVLQKRAAMRECFGQFDPQIVATYTDDYLDSLMNNPDIIRNKRKLYAARANARAVQLVQERVGSFDSYIWSFVNGVPIINSPEKPEDIPAATPLSETMSRELRQRGFQFVGPTTCYAFMQSVGMVNDHMAWCDWNEKM